MNERGFENRLRGYLSAEVQRVEPAGWWDNVIPRLPERPPAVSFGERIKAVFSNPVWRVAIPVTVVVVAAAVMIWQPWSNGGGSEGVIAKAQAAIEAVKSYRLSLVTTRTEGGKTSESVLGVEFVAPDRYHVAQAVDGDKLEFIMIGDETYFKENSASSLSARLLAGTYSSLVTREATVRTLDLLKDVKKLPDEAVDGVLYLHYRGEYDYEKDIRAIEERSRALGMRPKSEEEIAERVRYIESSAGPTTIELWIGKDDYLVRRMMRNQPNMNTPSGEVSVRGNVRFSDFNAQLVVGAPRDANGQLLSGWTSTAPDSPNFSADIRSAVDNYDPSHRKIDYAINVTNTGAETLAEVEVRIAAGSLENASAGTVSHSWNDGQSVRGPYTLEPGDSLKYTSTFRYDATSISPDVIAGVIRNSSVEITYDIPGGEPKVETFRFEPPDSIYTLPTDVPPNLVPVQLTPAGEYRIEERGARSSGGGITGEINGKNYLFVAVSTQGGEVQEAPPGVLVLDIEDIARPKKVGYLSAPEGTRFMMYPSLSGTTLYAYADGLLWVVDVSDPASPKELAALPELRTNLMVVSGQYAFATEGDGEIAALDLSNAARPEKVGGLRLPSSSGLVPYLYGEYLMVEANDTLYTVDISEPTSMKIVNEFSFENAFETPGETPDLRYHSRTIALGGEYAYVVINIARNTASGLIADGWGVLVLSIADPASPNKVAFIELKERSVTGPVFVTGDRLYVVTQGTSGPPGSRKTSVEFIDISDPTHPVKLGFAVLPDYWTFFENFQGRGASMVYGMVGNYLYWHIGNEPNQPVIEIFDLSGL